eukprot:PhM_4_TR7172/c0_g1_i1/m.27735
MKKVESAASIGGSRFSTYGSMEQLHIVVGGEGRSSSAPAGAQEHMTRAVSLATLEELYQAAHIVHPPSGTIATSALTILSSTIGGGVLALSSALDDASFVYGILLIFSVSLMSTLSMRLLVRMSEKTQKFSYLELCEEAFGSVTLTRIMGLVIALYCFGLCVAYLVLIRDSLAPLLLMWVPNAPALILDGRLVLLFIVPTLIYFASRRNFAELLWASFLAFATIAYVAVIFFVRFGQNPVVPSETSKNVIRWAVFEFSFWRALPIVTCSFAMHFSIPHIYHELKDRSPTRMAKAIWLGIFSTTAFYLSVAIIGYLAWGAAIQNHGGDLLAQYSHQDKAINFGRALMVIHFVCVFPLIAVGGRRAMNDVLFDGEDHLPNETLYQQSMVLLFLCMSVVFMFPDSINSVLAFNGALFGTNIVLTIPAMMYWKIKPEMGWKRRVGTTVLIIFGIMSSVIGVISTAKKMSEVHQAKV